MDDLTMDVPATRGLRALFVDVADNREPVRLELLLVVLPLLLWLRLLYSMLLLLLPLFGRMMFTAFGWLVSFVIGCIGKEKEKERIK